jgi:transposase-like protein
VQSEIQRTMLISLRKIIKTRGGFHTEEAALKLLFLALRQAAKK